MILREVEKPRLRDVLGRRTLIIKNDRDRIAREFLSGVNVVGSGKGAIALILKYLTARNIIKDKLDEVLVADWIGVLVYAQIQLFAFPAKRFSDRTKVIIAYHQYGFPQDMDKILAFAREKNLVVIEDCAHALRSFYKGKPLGSMGDFSIFSFSKWFFCFALGGVTSTFGDFKTYVETAVAKTAFGLTIIKDSTKLFYEWSTFSASSKLQQYAYFLLSMSYALYGEAVRPGNRAQRLLESKIENEVSVRQKRYRYFLDQTKDLGICDHLEREGVTPYVIPIHCPESKNKVVVNALRKVGVLTGVYHFDKNRNMLSPNFISCVWVPCHSGISDDVFSDITEAVSKSFKKPKYVG